MGLFDEVVLVDFRFSYFSLSPYVIYKLKYFIWHIHYISISHRWKKLHEAIDLGQKTC